MFPSLLVQPEVTAFSPFLAYFILSFGFLIARLKKVLVLAFLAAILISPAASAFMAIPGGCGTMCMAQQQQWGMPMFYPGAYMYPQLTPPWMFYGNPTSFYQMMPPWYYYGQPQGFRGYQ